MTGEGAAERVIVDELGPLAARIGLLGVEFAASPDAVDPLAALEQHRAYYRQMVRLCSEAARKADHAIELLSGRHR